VSTHITHPSMNHPITVMFGRQAVLSVEVSSPTKENALPGPAESDHGNRDKLIDEHFLFHSKKVEEVKANIVNAQARQRKAYDKKNHNPSVSNVILWS